MFKKIPIGCRDKIKESTTGLTTQIIKIQLTTATSLNKAFCLSI